MKKLFFSLMCLISLTAFSQPQTVNIGAAPNDGTGDNLRTAFSKVNANDQYFETRFNSLSELTPYTTIFITDKAAAASDTSVSIFVAADHPWVGKNLVQLTASWSKKFGSAVISVIAQRLRAGTWVNMTTTGATFTGESTAEAASINLSNNGVQLGDRVRFISIKESGTSPVGVQCQAIFQQP